MIQRLARPDTTKQRRKLRYCSIFRGHLNLCSSVPFHAYEITKYIALTVLHRALPYSQLSAAGSLVGSEIVFI